MFDELFLEKLADRVVVKLKPHLTGKIAPRYLNLDQAAEYMSTTPDAVRGMLRQKHLPARKVGARLLIDIRDIDKLMDESLTYLNQCDSVLEGDLLPDEYWR